MLLHAPKRFHTYCWNVYQTVLPLRIKRRFSHQFGTLVLDLSNQEPNFLSVLPQKIMEQLPWSELMCYVPAICFSLLRFPFQFYSSLCQLFWNLVSCARYLSYVLEESWNLAPISPYFTICTWHFHPSPFNSGFTTAYIVSSIWSCSIRIFILESSWMFNAVAETWDYNA
jgi:hypothetical protein